MSLMKEKVGSVGKEEDQHQGASRESASGGRHKHGSKLLLVFLLRLLCPPFPGCKIKPVVGRGGRWTSLDASFARCFAIF